MIHALLDGENCSIVYILNIEWDKWRALEKRVVRDSNHKSTDSSSTYLALEVSY